MESLESRQLLSIAPLVGSPTDGTYIPEATVQFHYVPTAVKNAFRADATADDAKAPTSTKAIDLGDAGVETYTITLNSSGVKKSVTVNKNGKVNPSGNAGSVTDSTTVFSDLPKAARSELKTLASAAGASSLISPGQMISTESASQHSTVYTLDTQAGGNNIAITVDQAGNPTAPIGLNAVYVPPFTSTIPGGVNSIEPGSVTTNVGSVFVNPVSLQTGAVTVLSAPTLLTSSLVNVGTSETLTQLPTNVGTLAQMPTQTLSPIELQTQTLSLAQTYSQAPTLSQVQTNPSDTTVTDPNTAGENSFQTGSATLIFNGGAITSSGTVSLTSVGQLYLGSITLNSQGQLVDSTGGVIQFAGNFGSNPTDFGTLQAILSNFAGSTTLSASQLASIQALAAQVGATAVANSSGIGFTLNPITPPASS